MILSFTALNKQGQIRSFSCHLNKMETALDTLSTISSQGDVIITAQLIDGGNQMELPVDAFDGESLSKPIRQLEEQWQAILGKPAQVVSPATSWRLEMTRQQLRLCNQRIDYFTTLIHLLEELRQQAEELLQTESRRAKLIGRYNTMLSQYYNYLERTKANQYMIQQKVHRLAC